MPHSRGIFSSKDPGRLKPAESIKDPDTHREDQTTANEQALYLPIELRTLLHEFLRLGRHTLRQGRLLG
jgi:hypothetical protein